MTIYDIICNTLNYENCDIIYDIFKNKIIMTSFAILKVKAYTTRDLHTLLINLPFLLN